MVQPPASVLTLCVPTVPVPGSKGSEGGVRVGEAREPSPLAASFSVFHSCKPRDHWWLLPGGEVHELVASELTVFRPLLLHPHPHLIFS